ncbi:hypothetical protein AWH56_008840 [Anaerobacillus isosaccharinicus]|uniref:Uncharacterized protein n=1 Tax=Anaerobacillus isosaccharinicus TaxID=1532552 RepID=A0A1S2L1I7_9BACI|nr:hypothetical protein [Anaerobacillus isosaccharinicus]MBA5588922.1 hypothetical protein [Anaerobacillus isosaccharinicus]QOY37667.1 hypothetical protein AWH56_008840 [Anaerobacillus isosaccharinicus]
MIDRIRKIIKGYEFHTHSAVFYDNDGNMQYGMYSINDDDELVIHYGYLGIAVKRIKLKDVLEKVQFKKKSELPIPDWQARIIEDLEKQKIKDEKYPYVTRFTVNMLKQMPSRYPKEDERIIRMVENKLPVDLRPYSLIGNEKLTKNKRLELLLQVVELN